MSDSWASAGLDLHIQMRHTRRRASLEEELREAIHSGRLTAGTRLPSSRGLAGDLGLSRGTVTAAYDQLVAEGYLVARQGTGTVVAELGAARPRTVIRRQPPGPSLDLRPGTPDVTAFPLAEWLRCARKALLAAGSEAFGYGDQQGRPELRAELVDYLGRTRGVRATPDQVVITSGYVQGLSLVCRALRSSGTTRIAMENPGFWYHRGVARRAGLEVVPLPVDARGARPEHLSAPEADGVRAVVVTPSHQYPIGVTMHATRRQSLATWARYCDGLIIEDDYDGEFRYDRQPVGALQGTAPDHVAYLGSVSKTLSPAVRLGWIVLPPDLLDRVLEEMLFSAFGVDTLAQLTFAQLIASHGYDKHIRSMRRRYRQRFDLLGEALSTGRPPSVRSEDWPAMTGVPAGLQALVELPGHGPSEVQLIERAEAAGLALQGLAEHFQSDAEPARKGIVVGFSQPSPASYPTALALLTKVFAATYA